MSDVSKRRLAIYAECLNDLFERAERAVDALDAIAARYGAKEDESVDELRGDLIMFGQSIEDCRGNIDRGGHLPGNVSKGQEWLIADK